MGTRKEIRDTRFTEGAMAEAVGESMRDAQRAIDTVPLTSYKTFDYTATGTTAATIDLLWSATSDTLVRESGGPPRVALVVRVVDTTDESGNPGDFRPSLNFDYVSSPSGQNTVKLYEPEGLTADTKYRITVMFVG